MDRLRKEAYLKQDSVPVSRLCHRTLCAQCWVLVTSPHSDSSPYFLAVAAD